MKFNFLLFEIENMPFCVFFDRSSINYNGVNIFDDYQLGFISFRKYKSKNSKILWNK
jgi:hypothetical protein